MDCPHCMTPINPDDHEDGRCSYCGALADYGIMDPDYARFVSKARCIARSEGYAIAVHGSMTRDLDVIAIPWVEKPNSSPSQLAHQIAGRTGLTLHPEIQLREHGRIACTMLFPESGDPRFVDFSVMPPFSCSSQNV